MLRNLLVATSVVVFTLSVAVSAQATASLEEVQERLKDVLEHKDTYDRAIAGAKETQQLIDSAKRTLAREEAKFYEEQAEKEKIERRRRNLADNPDIRIGALREDIQRYETAADVWRVQIEITQEEITQEEDESEEQLSRKMKDTWKKQLAEILPGGWEVAELQDENELGELTELEDQLEEQLEEQVAKFLLAKLEKQLARILELTNSRNDEIRRLESKQEETMEMLAEELRKKDEILRKLQETVIEQQEVLASHRESCRELVETVRGAREAIVKRRISQWKPHIIWLMETPRTLVNEALLEEMMAAIQSMGIAFPDGDQEQIPVSCG